MSEAVVTEQRAPKGALDAKPARRAPRSLGKVVAYAALLLLLLAIPLYVEEFWLRTGFAVFGAIVGAIGLLLSLFFLSQRPSRTAVVERDRDIYPR